MLGTHDVFAFIGIRGWLFLLDVRAVDLRYPRNACSASTRAEHTSLHKGLQKHLSTRNHRANQTWHQATMSFASRRHAQALRRRTLHGLCLISWHLLYQRLT